MNHRALTKRIATPQEKFHIIDKGLLLISHLVRWALWLMAAKFMSSVFLGECSEGQGREVERKELGFADREWAGKLTLCHLMTL